MSSLCNKALRNFLLELHTSQQSPNPNEVPAPSGITNVQAVSDHNLFLFPEFITWSATPAHFLKIISLDVQRLPALISLNRKNSHITSPNGSQCPQISPGFHKQSRMQTAEYNCLLAHGPISKCMIEIANRGENCGLVTFSQWPWFYSCLTPS